MSATAAPLAPARGALSLRTLYLVRAAFSVVWVALVFVLASTVTTGTKPSIAAFVSGAILLIRAARRRAN